MSKVITKTSGFHIIDGRPVLLGVGQQVSYASTAVVQSFDTEEEMLAVHRENYPEWYDTEAQDDLGLGA